VVIASKKSVLLMMQIYLKCFLIPMVVGAQDPFSSMGIDSPIAVLSDRPRLLFDYFKQSFAQVINPAIDPIRVPRVSHYILVLFFHILSIQALT
jgi:glutamate synthase (NADPH/NADH) large chain